MGASHALPIENETDDEFVPELRRPNGLAGERVLLLEDDPNLSDVLRDFLVESGYSVVTGRNGVDGISQIMAGEFAVILCDLRMPTLSGDMFFRTVERMRPALCDRFVFMTGHQGHQRSHEFIRSVNGKVLAKPFPVDELLDTCGLIQARTHLEAMKLPSEMPRSSVRPGTRRQPEEPCLTVVLHRPLPAPVLPAPFAVPAAPAAALPRLLPAPAAPGKDAGSNLPVYLGIGLCAFLVMLLGFWFLTLRDGGASAAVEPPAPKVNPVFAETGKVRPAPAEIRLRLR